MEKEKLIKEHSFTLESLLEKEKFVYSEEFYNLDENEKKKVIDNKMANEAYLKSLSNTLWSDDVNTNSFDPFGLLLFAMMFGYSGTMPKFPTLPQSPTYSIPTDNNNVEENKEK